eukprot:TRINITY_DN1035_c0_g1_i1.p1 TRINITY_DN1035_c0_g1~~TRINITY_DN1035_c0_g1_i1.p1  ORF type:complete len:1060 (+),score=190.11 TRINITY_DN1035_c0_g1_i1:97-3180(+)
MKSQELDVVPEQAYGSQKPSYAPSFAPPLIVSPFSYTQQGINNPLMRPQSAKHPAPQGLVSASYHGSDFDNPRPVMKSSNRPTTTGQRRTTLFPKSMAAPDTQRRGLIAKPPTEDQIQQESLRYKQDMNAFKLENIQFKTKIQQLERDIDKKNRLIQSILEQVNNEQAGTTQKRRFDIETPIVLSLKKQIKDLKDEVKGKADTLSGLEKSLKATRIDEMELQLKVITEECINLRSAIEENLADTNQTSDALQNIKQIEEKLHQQSIMLTNMRKENEQLVVSIKRKEKDLQEAQERAAKVEARAKKYAKEHKDFARNKMRLLNAKKELVGLRKQVEMLKVDKEDQGTDIYQNRIEELIQQQRDLETKITEKEEKIMEIRREEEYFKREGGEKVNESQVLQMKAQVEQCNFAIMAQTAIDEAELSEVQKAKKPVEAVKSVSKDSIINEVKAVKYVLMNLGIHATEMEKAIFKGFYPEDSVTIYEFTRMMTRMTGRQKADSEKLARFVIEPEGEEHEYNEFLEGKMEQVCEKLRDLVGRYFVFSEERESELKQSITEVLFEVIKNQKLRKVDVSRLDSIEASIIKSEDVRGILRSLKLALTDEEREYVILSMYKASRDVERLPTGEMVKLFKELSMRSTEEIEYVEDEHPEVLKSDEEVPEEVGEKKDGPEIIEEPIKESIGEKEEEKHRLPVSQSVPQEQSSNPLVAAGSIELTEEEVIETAQKVFAEVAEKLQAANLTPKKLFEAVTFKEQTEEGEEELIPSEDFLKGIEDLGVPAISPKSQQCILKVLAATEDEKFIRLTDFVQVMDDYAGMVQSYKEESAKKVFPMKIHELDKISMVVMLALAEYLHKENINVQDVFAGKTCKKSVKTKTKRKEIEILQSEDFFKVLHEIGIKTEDEEHENLKAFLQLDPNYPDKIHMRKLVKAVKVFSENEEVRDYARECYQELVSEDDVKSSEQIRSTGELRVEDEKVPTPGQEEEYYEKEEPYEEEVEVQSAKIIKNRRICHTMKMKHPTRYSKRSLYYQFSI